MTAALEAVCSLQSIDTLACIEHLLHRIAVLSDEQAAAAVAAFQGDVNAASQLAASKAQTPLMVAVLRDKPMTVAALAARGDLHMVHVYAVLKSHLRLPRGIITTLLNAFERDIDLDAPLCALGRTALHVAAAHNRLEAVQALLHAGANPVVVDVHGDTPAKLARRAGQHHSSEIVRLLDKAEATGARGRIFGD